MNEILNEYKFELTTKWSDPQRGSLNNKKINVLFLCELPGSFIACM